jgi:hypothetical protein
LGAHGHHDRCDCWQGLDSSLSKENDGGHPPPGVQKLLCIPPVASARCHGPRRCAPPATNFSKTTTACRSSRQLCCIKKKKKKVTRRLAAHLRDMDRTHRGPQRSLRLIVRGWNAEFPPDNPICFCAFVRRGGTFLCKENHTGAPPDGYRLVIN